MRFINEGTAFVRSFVQDKKKNYITKERFYKEMKDDIFVVAEGKNIRNILQEIMNN